MLQAPLLVNEGAFLQAAVLAYLEARPGATGSQIADAMLANGVTRSRQSVAVTLCRLTRLGKLAKTGQQRGRDVRQRYRYLVKYA